MNRADEFARDMCRELKGHLGLDWAPESKHRNDEGVDTRETADVVGKKGEKRKNERVLIEAELRRIAPAGNVIKVWKRVNEGKYSRHLVMFQAFSAFYPKNSTQRRNAEFIGKQMEAACGVRYVPLSIDYRPAKRLIGSPVMVGAGRRHYHAVKLARRVIAHLRRMKIH